MQQLQLLLGGYAYNFYGEVNRARSDDLLVRERASGSLAQAEDRLSRLRTECRAALPPLTRDDPAPPEEALAQLREMQAIQQSIGRLEAHVRGMQVPAVDRVWWRFRQELPLLRQLLSFDLSLVSGSEALERQVSGLAPDGWGPEMAAELRQQVAALETVARERQRFLTVPVDTGPDPSQTWPS